MNEQKHHADIRLLDLASEVWGGAAIWTNDDFFAPKENLVRAAEPVWKEDVYTERGKWMDGWESRRRRTPGHDVCIVRLGVPGAIERVIVDTSFFRGNYPESCMIEGCSMPNDAPLDALQADAIWEKIVDRSDLEGDSKNAFDVVNRRRWTHLRLHIFPDGGVARLRVYGTPIVEPWSLRGGRVDLVSGLVGGATIAQSDMFFGLAQNLLKPEKGVNMGDGWETKRRRGPGHDWVVLSLAAEGVVDVAEVDTLHFKGNYPDRCSMELYPEPPDDPTTPREEHAAFREQKLQAHTRHDVEVVDDRPATHAVFRIYPDGGVSRLRLWGSLTDRGQSAVGLRWLNGLSDEGAADVFRSCCSSDRWVDGMVEGLPYDDEAELHATADAVWSDLGRQDFLEAFAGHPRIGERKKADAATEQSASWSEGEQAGTASAASETMDDLQRLNERYYEKHGFIFIICASDRSAEEMLAALRERVENSTPDEIENAAREQAEITKLRLSKWLRTCQPNS